jgi:hypothetical protein
VTHVLAWRMQLAADAEAMMAWGISSLKVSQNGLLLSRRGHHYMPAELAPTATQYLAVLTAVMVCKVDGCNADTAVMNVTYPKLGAALKKAAQKAGLPSPWYSCSWPDCASVQLGLVRQLADLLADSYLPTCMCLCRALVCGPAAAAYGCGWR